MFRAGIAAAVTVGVVLGGATITREPLGNDEIASLALVSRSFGQLASDFTSTQSAGMLFHLALWPIVALGGVTSFWLRLPSLLAFAGAIAVCGVVGARLGGRAVGLCAALFLSVCPFALFHAQDARMYTFALLFSLLAFWSLLRALEAPGELGRWLTYVAAVVATGYSHEFALLSVIAHVPMVILDARIRTRKSFGLAIAGAGVLLAPLAVVSVHNSGLDPLYYLTAPDVQSVQDTVLFFAGSRPAAAACALAIAFGGVAGIRLRRTASQMQRRRAISIAVALGLWVVAPFSLLFLVSQVEPIFTPRYVISSAAAASLGLALLLALLPRPYAKSGMILLALAFAYGAVQEARALERPNWPGAARFVESHARAGRIVVVGGQRNAAALLYYAPSLGLPRDGLPWTEAELSHLPRRLTMIDRDNSLDDLQAALSGGPTWVVQQGQVAPGMQQRFDRFLDSCDAEKGADLRLITISLVTRCPPTV